MSSLNIPCLLMRGGTSKGLYFHANDLPKERESLARLLIGAMGAGSPLQVDGIGGSRPTTSKVAILSQSEDAWAEVDYFFAQVHPEKAEVDFSPSCGNILAGVGPAALEMGLVAPQGEESLVKIRSVNTASYIEARVKTPQGMVQYEGNARIDGVPGSASPILLNFRNVLGSKTGALFPTGTPTNRIDGIAVTCMDVAMPMMIARASDFGVTGYENCEELDDNPVFFEHLETLRIQAGERMGFKEVKHSVIPKVALLARPRESGTIAARYFTPWNTHPSFAVTGSICTGACLLAPETVAQGLAHLSPEHPTPIKIEHPSGMIEVRIDYQINGGEFQLNHAGLLRTARKLFSGTVHVPSEIRLHDE